MDRAQAAAYLSWRYGPPYEFYNTPPACLDEAMAEIFSGGSDYYAVLDGGGGLYGIFEYAFPDGVMEIGLGIRPADAGKGQGRAFAGRCIAFGRETYRYSGPVRLKVADFNARAIRLYRQMGFVQTGEEPAVSYGRPVTFLVMELVPESTEPDKTPTKS